MAGVRSDSGSRRGARPNILCDHILWHHGDPARISDPRGGGLGGGRTPPATARSRPRANRDSVAGTRREAGDSLRLARSRRCRWPERSRSDLDRRLTGAVPRALPPFLRDARAKGRDGHPRLHSRRVRSHCATAAFAELASREAFFAYACFHGQQAAEKALTAFLYARGAEHVLGHSVADLAADPRATRTPCRAVCLLTRSSAPTPSARSTWPAR